jgi:hypothetical protein
MHSGRILPVVKKMLLDPLLKEGGPNTVRGWSREIGSERGFPVALAPRIWSQFSVFRKNLNKRTFLALIHTITQIQSFVQST